MHLIKLLCRAKLSRDFRFRKYISSNALCKSDGIIIFGNLNFDANGTVQRLKLNK